MKTIIWYFIGTGDTPAGMLQQRGEEILDDMRDRFSRSSTI